VTDLIHSPRVEERPTPGEPGDDPGLEPTGGAPSSNSLLGLVALAGFFALVGLVFGLSVVLIILAVVVSIFLHETGHYVAARRSGMKVTEYFIGFGPRIWSFRRGETEYGIKAIWVGAYVKIIGMNNLEEVDPADESRTYRRQSYPKRVITAFAGPAMNFVFAFVLLLGLALVHGLPGGEVWPRVEPAEGSAAAAAGLEPGDELVSFAGEPVGSFEDFRRLVANHGGQTVEVVFVRDGVEQTVEADIGLRVAGIASSRWPGPIDVVADSDAAAAGLTIGDEIVTVDGQPTPEGFDEFSDLLVDARGSSVELVVERDGVEYGATMELAPETRPLGLFGVSRYDEPATPLGPVEAITESADRFGEMAWASVYGLYRFFSPSGLSGFANDVVTTPPVESSSPSPGSGDSVVVGGEEASLTPLPPPSTSSLEDEDRVHSILGIGSQLRLEGIVGLLALLNIFLAVFNLIPLLPFDGGHIAVATYERIREGLARRRLVSATLVSGRYLADFAKLLPVTYAVVGLIVAIGAGALWLDAIDPPTVN
jgi:RIP metalloprotease RseP